MSQALSIISNPAGRTPAMASQYAVMLDLAMGVSEDDILEAHGLQHHELQAFMADNNNANQIEQMQKELAKDGVSFRTKSRLIAEAMLDDVWQLSHDPSVSPAVKADLIKSVVRWADYDNSKGQNGGGATSAFQLNIILGGN